MKKLSHTAYSPWGAVFLSVITALGLLLWIFSYSNYGLDFTDEGYYLNWISDPFQYNWGSTQFGFVYHPIYLLVDGKIGLLRVANVLLTVGLATWMVKVFLDGFILSNGNKIIVWGLAFSLSTLSLLHFSWGFMSITLNYNSLNLQAIILLVVGICYLEKNRFILSGLILGVGATLVLLAKPTSLILLVPLILLFCILRKRLTPGLCLATITAVVVSLGMAILLIDGSLTAFIDRVLTGKEFRVLQHSKYSFFSMFRLDKFSLSKLDTGYFCLLSLCTLAILLFSIRKKWRTVINLSLGMGVILLLINLVFLGNNIQLFISNFTLLVLMALPISIIAFAVILNGAKRPADPVGWRSQSEGRAFDSTPSCEAGFHTQYERREARLLRYEKNCPAINNALLLSVFFFAISYSFSVGTNNNYWLHMSWSGLFWLLAGICFIRIIPKELQINSITIISLLSQAVVAVFINNAIEHPYRQPESLRNNSSVINIGQSHSKMVLSKGYARYIQEAKQKADNAGFKEGDSIIDMTGQSPGLIYALGAKGLAGAWLVGGYPGSNQFIAAAIERERCEDISQAWLLFDDGPRQLNYNLIIQSYGSQPNNYEIVASWHTASGAGGFRSPRQQWLLKPKDTETIKINCINSRRE